MKGPLLLLLLVAFPIAVPLWTHLRDTGVATGALIGWLPGGGGQVNHRNFILHFFFPCHIYFLTFCQLNNSGCYMGIAFMSGGAIFRSRGQLILVQTADENYKDMIKYDDNQARVFQTSYVLRLSTLHGEATWPPRLI